jgi:DNA-binding SARP family transcriptional activator/Tfp pilus assembly protein PilF
VTAMEFGLLGSLVVRRDGATVPVQRGNQRALLAALLLHANQVVATDQIVETLWGPGPPPSAQVTIRNYVRRLRQAFGDADRDRIVAQPNGYLISVAADELDVARFEGLLRSARAAARDGSWAAAAEAAGSALSLWRGTPLADVESDTLTSRQSPRLAEMRLQALETRIEAELHLGRHADMTAELQHLASEYPLREQLHALLMLALYRCGRQGDALAVYREAHRQLADELGVEPGPALRELNQRILQSDPALLIQPSAEDAGLPQDGGAVAGEAAAPGPGAGPVPTEAGGTGAAAGAGTAAASGMGGAAASETGSAGGTGVAFAVVPRQLPRAPAGFLGRAAELGALTAALDQAGPRTPGTVVISAIGGTAGVGKTALAVHWAHQVAHRFPGGQLYVNLRGFDPSGAPVTPGEAIRGFLDALDVPAARIPLDLPAQAGLYRSVAADRKMLIVLDNARDEQQVRPLLPASPGCLVVVTSRGQLTGLAAADDARLVSLDLLGDAEARQMLSAKLGADRAAAEPDAVAQIARLCAYLPLALAVAAARAAARPGLPLSALAAELRDAAGRLDVLDTGDPAASVRAVFSWSTEQLGPAAAQMFRLLGIHPGPDISAAAAASLAGVGEPEARRLLAELIRAHLITEHVPGRFAFHDLLRAYAAEQAQAGQDDQARQAATGRMLDHYLHTATRAALLLDPAREPITLAPPRPGVVPGQPADHREALAWFEAEHQVLLAAVALAARSGFDAHAWQLPWAMTSFMQTRGRWQEWAAAQRTALAAATRLGDAGAQALSGRLLAMACIEFGDHDEARGHFADSLELYQRLGNRLGQARIHLSLGVLAGRQERYADAIGHAEQALRLYQEIGDKTSEAVTLNNVGWYHCLLGDYQQARTFCRRALTLSAETGDRRHEGHAWDSLGRAEHHLGNLAEAAACYQRALSLDREVGDRLNEAQTLTHLGDTYQAASELGQAPDAWQQALDILDDLDHPDAEKVRARLAVAARPPGPRPGGAAASPESAVSAARTA